MVKRSSHSARFLSLKPYHVLLTLTVVLCAVVSMFQSTASSNSTDRNVSRNAETRQDRFDKKKDNCRHCAPPANQAIYIPLMDLAEAKGSELVFNSRSASEMAVTPTFYKADGTIILGDVVNVNAEEIRYVKLRQLLPQQYRNDRDWGGMTLSYYGGNREMWAQLRFLNVNGGNSVDEFFTVKSESRSDYYEAAWWGPKGSISTIALGNITETATRAIVKVGNGLAQTINLAPHATQLIKGEVNALNEPASITIRVDGPAGSVVPTGIIASNDGSFNSVIRFYSPRLTKQANLYANGFRLKNVTPHMVLKNTTSASITARPKFSTLEGVTGNPVLLPDVLLGPNETREVDLKELLMAVKRRTDLDIVSVEVTNSGLAGSLIGSLYGINVKTSVNYDIPLRDSGPVRTMTGSYPWKITKDYTTVIYITNISDREAGFISQINHGGQKFVIDPGTLKPGETATFDLAKIRDEQMADNVGRRIPKETTVGQFKWAVRGVTDGKLLLIGRAEMVSRSEGISTSYSCNDPCPPTYGGSIDPFLPPIVVVGAKSTSLFETAYYDSGVTMGPYAQGGDWTISNPSIASCDPSSGHTVMVCGEAAGSGFLEAFIRMEQSYGYDGRDCYDNYNQYPVSGGQQVDVFDLSIEFSPGEIQPSGTDGNSATTVSVTTSPHTPGLSISMSVQSQTDGGHIGHSGTRPLGSFSPSSGTTNSSGTFSTTYTASAFGGSVNIRATVQGQTATNKALEVRIADLGIIASTNNWNLVGQTATHPSNHYGAPNANTRLSAIARDYNDVYYGVGNFPPLDERIRYNDMSLINGGKFELSGNWSLTTPHSEHRLGLNCDTGSNNIPLNRRSTLTNIFVFRGSPNYLDETGTSQPHWHLRF